MHPQSRTNGLKMACDSGCCGPPRSPVGATLGPCHQKQPLSEDGNDICHDKGGSTANKVCKVACGEDTEPDLPTINKLARNYGSSGESNEPAPHPTSRPIEAPVIANCRTMGMQIGCHKPLDTNLSGCDDTCCSGPAEKTQDRLGCGPKGLKFDDNCCSAISADHDCKNRTCSAPESSQVEDLDKPSCCKDSPSPCCDVSCLDRLALRACDSERQASRPDHASKSKQQ